MPPTNRETELKFHVGNLPATNEFTASLATLGWTITGTQTHTQHDTYVTDAADELARLHAALRWRERDGTYIVAVKQEQSTEGAHFTRFELEAQTTAPSSAHRPFLNTLNDVAIPARIEQWLTAHNVTGPFAPRLWITTKRTTITATHANTTAEFALDSVTAQQPGRKHAFTFYEIECEYTGSAHRPVLQHTERFLATLPGARPSPASKLDFSLRLL